MTLEQCSVVRNIPRDTQVVPEPPTYKFCSTLVPHSGMGELRLSWFNVKGPFHKTINLDTYKVHVLGDYVEAIPTYGTSDSYSTELVGKSQYNY